MHTHWCSVRGPGVLHHPMCPERGSYGVHLKQGDESSFLPTIAKLDVAAHRSASAKARALHDHADFPSVIVFFIRYSSFLHCTPA